MSCPHGVWHSDVCEECNALDASFDSGIAATKKRLLVTATDEKCLNLYDDLQEMHNRKVACDIIKEWLKELVDNI
jgi:hypothetical protein